MNSFFSKLIILLPLAILGLRAAEPAPTSEAIPLTPELVQRLLDEATSHSPAVAAASARADAASTAVDAVRTWEDPTATVGLSLPTARGFKSSEEGNLIYGIEQKLPLFNRPKLAREVAAADARREKLTVDFVTEKLRRDLTVGLVALGLADLTLDFAQQDLGWLDATRESVDHRYRVGKATQVEWLKIQTERAKVTDRIKTLALEREHRQVELNRMVNRDLHAPWPKLTLPAASPTQVAEDALTAAAIRAHPRVKIMQQEVTQAQALARVTHEQRRPEVGVGVQGRSYTGDAGFREGMVTVNFTLPWVNARRYGSDYARDRAKVRVSEQELADYSLGLREEIHHLTIDLDAANRQTVLYRDELIPLTEQTLSSASNAWSNNLGPFQDLLDARRMLVDHRLMLAQALADQTRLRADLSLLTGTADLAGLASTAQPAMKTMTMLGDSK